MIEISTIQDIRQIENKIILGFTAKQLMTIFIGIILDIIFFMITHEIGIVFIISAIVLFVGFFKKDNLTSFEYFSFWWDKQRQARIRTFKNKNIISEIERQCKNYKCEKKKK